MIIEATQTYSPGNVELLVFILKNIEQKNIKTKVYLGHDFTFNLIKGFNFENISIEKTSGFSTLIRHFSRRYHVLFFCSYPPVVRSGNSLVYFHSPFFTNPKRIISNKKISLKVKFIRLFVHLIIKGFNQNVDCFYCQTDEIEKELKNDFTGIRVRKVPFYNDSDLIAIEHQNNLPFEYDFFYPATPDAHKNYFRLFDAILIAGKVKKIRIAVTIGAHAVKYINKINEINEELKYDAIFNLGRISKIEVLKNYSKSKALVFPSLEESLGLPLIEATEIGCPIIGSNLPYIYNVVENPIVFDPYDIEDIADKMIEFLEGNFSSINQKNKIENKVEEIINFFN
jgi:glycosyltransferase involved in cell wall biosynthesis